MKKEALENMVYIEEAVMMANLLNLMNLMRYHMENRKAVEGEDNSEIRNNLREKILNAMKEFVKDNKITEDDVLLALYDVVIGIGTEIEIRRLSMFSGIEIVDTLNMRSDDDMTDYIG